MQTRAPLSFDHQPGRLGGIVSVIVALLLMGVVVFQAIPPQKIALAFTDVPQDEMTLPVHGQLLIRACKMVTIDSGDYRYSCDLGLLDLEKEHLVRLAHLDGEEFSSRIAWSPDGMRFGYHNTSWPGSSAATVVYRADGKEQYKLGAHGIGSWSADARYYTALTCKGPNIDPGPTITVVDTVSWKPVCAVCEGSVMSCPPPWPLDCSSRSECLPGEEAPEEYKSVRYQAAIEHDGVRVFDILTLSKKLYVIPGLQIMTIAWSPPDP